MSEFEQRRSDARVVAWIDLVFSIIGLMLVVIISLLFLLNWSEWTGSLSDKQFAAIRWLVGVFIILEIAVKLLELHASLQLIKATDVSADPRKALSMSTYWIWVNSIILTIEIILIFMSMSFFSLLFKILPILFIHIVNKFNSALGAVLNSTSNNATEYTAVIVEPETQLSEIALPEEDEE